MSLRHGTLDPVRTRYTVGYCHFCNRHSRRKWTLKDKRKPSSPLNNDFPKVATTFLKPESIPQLFKRKTLVDHRAQIILLQRCNTFLLLTTASGNQTLQTGLLGHQQRAEYLTTTSGRYADQSNVTANRNSLQRRTMRAEPTDLNNVSEKVYWRTNIYRCF
tara:strand:- start:51515 stop:51997 length:483 start_codon:yes stop_codon:yes gene_type:complete